MHRILDVQFREDDCRIRKEHAPAVMGILRRTVLNMVRMIQGNLGTAESIGLLRDRIGHRPWIWPPPCPERDFAFALSQSLNVQPLSLVLFGLHDDREPSDTRKALSPGYIDLTRRRVPSIPPITNKRKLRELTGCFDVNDRSLSSHLVIGVAHSAQKPLQVFRVLSAVSS